MSYVALNASRVVWMAHSRPGRRIAVAALSRPLPAHLVPLRWDEMGWTGLGRLVLGLESLLSHPSGAETRSRQGRKCRRAVSMTGGRMREKHLCRVLRRRSPLDARQCAALVFTILCCPDRKSSQGWLRLISPSPTALCCSRTTQRIQQSCGFSFASPHQETGKLTPVQAHAAEEWMTARQERMMGDDGVGSPQKDNNYDEKNQIKKHTYRRAVN
ncbi:hypothetical protein B0I35DRAFT_128383 [Stachybotrys elegans]|uniref:Uncharacterized protein n=1 Tax=Stachybotrys elegans TaxID=80388 RepID=A0A8K0SYR3_9HYPO|nr:hypothetical protein B0I35DRAFT_128383 [Stachybotrys elegans]